MGNKTKDFLKNSVGYIAVAFISAIYITSAFITVGETGKTVGQVIADSAVIFFMGILVNRIFELQGIMNGDKDERVVLTFKLHGEIVTKISPHIDKLDLWCEMKNKQSLKDERTRILASGGLKYDVCFDDNGVAFPFLVDNQKLKDKYIRNTELRKLKSYIKATKLKLTPLSAGMLTSEGGTYHDPYNMGMTKGEWRTQSGIKDVFVKVATAILFGYYGVQLVKDFTYAKLIWTTLQVGIFLIMGVVRMYQSYLFVTDEFRGRIIKKIDNLQKFDNFISKENTKEQNNVQ